MTEFLKCQGVVVGLIVGHALGVGEPEVDPSGICVLGVHEVVIRLPLTPDYKVLREQIDGQRLGPVTRKAGE